ncbi:MAG: PEP/pyruvate-binding domain-containing protein [Thermomicrobiaceae bacterium]|nr:PEP/pyruvate-binding domain-containing protein [Thermomicrobiaceae bacterium]
MTTRSRAGSAIRWFGEEPCHVVEHVGGKGASLSRMSGAGLAVPPGFVVCAEAFAAFLDANDARPRILAALADLDVERQEDLEAASREIKALIQSLPLPAARGAAIAEAYAQLGDGAGGDVAVAVRSSAIAEDSEAASFAGQQETYLNVRGAGEVAAHVRRCWASFFGANAIFYRRSKGSLADTAIAVVVQRMVTPDKAGVLFTVDPVSRRRDRMVVEAIWGFGEAVVSGLVVPDNYQIARRDGRVVRATVPAKTVILTRHPSGSGLVESAVPAERARERVLSDEELAELVALGERVEGFFGGPQDIEWAIEGGRLYLLQSRPITTL